MINEIVEKYKESFAFENYVSKKKYNFLVFRVLFVYVVNAALISTYTYFYLLRGSSDKYLLVHINLILLMIMISRFLYLLEGGIENFVAKINDERKLNLHAKSWGRDLNEYIKKNFVEYLDSVGVSNRENAMDLLISLNSKVMRSEAIRFRGMNIFVFIFAVVCSTTVSKILVYFFDNRKELIDSFNTVIKDQVFIIVAAVIIFFIIGLLMLLHGSINGFLWFRHNSRINKNYSSEIEIIRILESTHFPSHNTPVSDIPMLEIECCMEMNRV